MKKLITIITALLFLIPVTTLAKTAESKTSPPTLQQIAPGTYYYNYNIEEIEKTPEGGKPETWYQYSYVIIEGKPSKKKVLDAIAEAESSTTTEVVEGIAAERTTAQEKLAEISAMNYTQIDSYIENVFGSLNTAQKASLKELYKSVLALIKQLDLE